jgi:NAD(P)-dependent dehydrogenase (short-subunit alcohol dehydrogenase family)
MIESIHPGMPLSACPDCSAQNKDCALFAWPCPFRLDNELALITGGGSGLGLAMARCMADAGARVLLAGRREEVLQQAVESIGPRANYLCHDVTRLREAPQLVAEIRARFGPITIAVNNAGIHLKKPALETTEEEFMLVLTTHVLGAHAISRAVAPGMIERRGGAILFIASMASLIGVPQIVAYSAAKTAYLGMVRALAAELSPQGVRVNAIAPGWIESGMARHVLQDDPERERKVLSRTPMGTLGMAEDVGMAAVYLCSPAAKFITGVVLPVDGGASIGF